MAAATPVKGWSDWLLGTRKNPLSHATHIIILLETSVSGVTVELRREQEVVRGVLQHNCIAHDSDRPTIWDACVCRIDASNSELDVYTEVLKAISGIAEYPQLFLLPKPTSYNPIVAAITPLPIPVTIVGAVPMFDVTAGKPSELVFELNEHERTRQAITDLFAPATGVDHPSMWVQMTMPSGDVVWVNEARYRKPSTRRRSAAVGSTDAAGAAAASSSTAGEEEIVIRDPTQTPAGLNIERGSRNLRYSRPVHRGGLVWEQITLKDGSVFWENRLTREVLSSKPADADTLKLSVADMDGGTSVCTAF